MFFYLLFIGINGIGLILGWFINNLYSNWYTFKIVGKIERKYNQKRVINKLKTEIEMDHCEDGGESKSIETIVTEKRTYEKEKVFNKSSDCAYISKFIIINQYKRTPEIYLHYWNYLHGIRKFIFFNKECYNEDEAKELIEKINYISEKALYKCANLTKSIFLKYLIFNSVLLLEIDELVLNANDNTSKNNINSFEIINIRNQSLQHHLASLNSLKNLMMSLKTLDGKSDILNAMIANEELTNILNSGEVIYKKYVSNSNFSKESLELYILFLRNSM
eukprot:jgi/Orpsp1_1/1180147/evm.model.c7180000072310.1